MNTHQSYRPPAMFFRYRLPDRTSLAIGTGILLLFLAAMGATATAAWSYWYAQRIYPGVYIAGIAMTGQTRPQALTLLQEQGVHIQRTPVQVRYGDQHWILGSTHPVSSPFLAHLVDQAYQIGRDGTLGENLKAQATALGTGIHIEVQAVYGADEIDHFVTAILRDLAVRSPSQSPQVDTEWLVAQIDRVIQDGLVTPIRLEETDEASARIWSRASALLRTEPLLLSHPQFTHRVALDPQWITAAVVQQQPLVLDRDVLAAAVKIWSPLFERTPRNARVRFDASAGGLYVQEPSRMGVALDVEQTVTAIVEALQQGLDETRLHLTFTEPRLRGHNLDQYGIRELVGTGTSYFRGSSAARVRNIELTTAQFESILIPPGDIFSFNEHVGQITAAAGFADAAIIWGDRTAIGVGGGVCQVSTTIFRAAFASGLPIVERYNHGYVVSWYGQPGQDATIFAPYVDFKFRNDTAAYLLLQPDLDVTGGTLTFNLYGTRPERVVTISEPVISAVVDPPDPVYLPDSSLAPGVQRLVESEKLGLTVAVERSIQEGEQVRTETLHSVYKPWRAVYLVGTEITPEAERTPPAATEAER